MVNQLSSVSHIDALRTLSVHYMRHYQFGSAIGTLNGIIKQKRDDIWAIFYRGIAKSMIQARVSRVTECHKFRKT